MEGRMEGGSLGSESRSELLSTSPFVKEIDLLEQQSMVRRADISVIEAP
jgi:hypothetical protein